MRAFLSSRPLLLLLSLLPLPTLTYTPLSDTTLASLSAPASNFDIHDKAHSLLAPLLIPRVSGTEGNAIVQAFFLDFFAKQLPAWNVSTHVSTSKTPATGNKDVPFTNIIATRAPPWTRGRASSDISYLTLAAHFDSKLTPTGFIGATDSAAPCAMILHAAREIDAALTAKWDAMEAAKAQGKEEDLEADLDGDQGVQILLLDGEEAMVSWTHTDSLYGARALAESWETDYGEMESGGMRSRNRLGSISLFVLLDLLGSAQPYTTVPSYFRTTHWAYKKMAEIESRLRKLGSAAWASASEMAFLSEKDKTENDQKARWLGGLIEDDHLPFMARGVEVLHLIATPFPTVWHKMEDDGEHLDIPSVQDWAKLVTAFTAEWMDLDAYLGKSTKPRRTEKSELTDGEPR